MWITELQTRMQPVKSLRARQDLHRDQHAHAYSSGSHTDAQWGPTYQHYTLQKCTANQRQAQFKNTIFWCVVLEECLRHYFVIFKRRNNASAPYPVGFWNQVCSRQDWELNRNPPGNTSLLKSLKTMKQWTKLTAWCWITSRMPWGPTLETDSKSESNEIWIKLVTSFWRHNGAAMVPQFAPPGLYPLVRIRVY